MKYNILEDVVGPGDEGFLPSQIDSDSSSGSEQSWMPSHRLESGIQDLLHANSSSLQTKSTKKLILFDLFTFFTNLKVLTT